MNKKFNNILISILLLAIVLIIYSSYEYFYQNKIISDSLEKINESNVKYESQLKLNKNSTMVTESLFDEISNAYNNLLLRINENMENTTNEIADELENYKINKFDIFDIDLEKPYMLDRNMDPKLISTLQKHFESLYTDNYEEYLKSGIEMEAEMYFFDQDGVRKNRKKYYKTNLVLVSFVGPDYTYKSSLVCVALQEKKESPIERVVDYITIVKEDDEYIFIHH